MIVYKIRRKSDPTKYVKGTPYYLSYDGTGRTFEKLGRLRAFITGVLDNHHKKDIPDWEVVELEVVERVARDVHEVITHEKILELLSRNYN
jgi:hypothetical protein